jgi:hypothetical protein
LGVVLVVVAFAAMMRVKTDVQTLNRERTQLANEQIKLRETKRVLEAEYAHLANPLRLQKLAQGGRYVVLDPLDVEGLVPSPLVQPQPRP